MTGDLVSDDAQVHEKARGVLDFWFGLTTEQHFAKDDALHDEIARRFASLRGEVVAVRAAGWREHPDTLLAAIILIDQFSRNLYRGEAAAFAHDDLAVSLTLHAIDMGWEDRYPAERRVFLYMPLMHAEDMPLQRLSVEKFAALGIEDNLKFARDHAAVIERFGRYPSRNTALGRGSTPEERDWIAEGGGW